MKIPGPDHPIDVAPHEGQLRAQMGDTVVAETSAALVLREASYPLVYYIPLADVLPGVLHPSSHTTHQA